MVDLRQRRPPVRSPQHLAWIRTHPCCVPGCPRRPVIAHHVRIGSNGGTGMKPSDGWAAPLCQSHHAEMHTIGWQSFETKYAVDLRHVAASLCAISPFIPA